LNANRKSIGTIVQRIKKSGMPFPSREAITVAPNVGRCVDSIVNVFVI